MIHATGNTFGHRDLFRAWRGRWNASDQRWEFDNLSTAQEQQLQKLVGVSVAKSEPRKIKMLNDDDEPFNFRSLSMSRSRSIEQREGRTGVYGDDERYLNYFQLRNPTAFFGFSSLPAFVDYVAGLKRPSNGRDTGWNEDDAEWCGTPDMPAALALARHGWLDGVAEADGLDIPHATAKRRQHGLAGGTVNVGRLLAGNPAHMVRRPKQPGRKTVTLFVETFISAGIDPDNAIRRAVLISRIADVMEREGYSCEIVAALTTEAGWGGSVGHQAAITLKQAGERLNLLDVVFALGHPSFFRRLLFAAVGAADECRSTWSSQGSPSAAFSKDHPCKPNEFYIRSLSLEQQIKLDDNDPLSMLRFIEPVGLPVSLRNM